jgi:hypothetical protein
MGLRNYVGKLGGAVYYMNNGQNIGRELAPEISNPRTTAQMRQRMQWANLVNTYKNNKEWMGHLSFENKKQTWSDYNAFMSANLQSTPVYLTKQQAEAGKAILAPYTMTKGSLPSVSYTVRESGTFIGLVTGIKVDVNDFTTLSELSQAIINSRTGWQNGDQFSIIVADDFNLDGSIRVWAIEFILDVNDDTPLGNIDTIWDLTLYDFIAVETVGSDSFLAISLSDVPRDTNWAAAVVHSRTIEGRTYVSTQAYVLANAPLALYEQYISTAAFDAAAESYGQSTRYFLDARTDAPANTVPMISSLTGTYQSNDTGSMAGFVITRGGTNTFKKGYTDTTTVVTIETSSNLDDGNYDIEFHVANSESRILNTNYSKVSDKVGVFGFVYEDAEVIDGKAGEFWLLHGSEVLDKIPVTAP